MPGIFAVGGAGGVEGGFPVDTLPIADSLGTLGGLGGVLVTGVATVEAGGLGSGITLLELPDAVDAASRSR